jgi:cytochrome c-type biogenesis protein CcmH
MRALLLGGLLLACSPGSVIAATPVDIYEFASPAQEARYRALIDEFRCPKCLNTNLSGSDAPIAQDLRRTVHRLLVVEGKSDDEIRDFLQQRYGDFVLYNPPLRPGTLILWGAPVFFALIGLLVLWRVLRQSNRAVQLSDSDEARIAEIVEQSSSGGKAS